MVAPRLAGAIRPQDTLARLGGDEFAVLCEQLPSETAATRIAGQLAGALEQPVALGGDEHVVSASIGIAVGARGSSAPDLLRDADAAMHQAKLAGRGRFEVFDHEMHVRVLDRVRTESALRAALAKRGDTLSHYQPLVSLRSGQIVGAEALARWRHPDWGPMSPGRVHCGRRGQRSDPPARRAGPAASGARERRLAAASRASRASRSTSPRGSCSQPDELATLIREVIAA